jgi:transposase
LTNIEASGKDSEGEILCLTARTRTVDLRRLGWEIMVGIKSYSEDLRIRIVQAVWDRMSKFGAARRFGMSLSSVKRYVRIAERGASLAPRKGGGRPPKTDRATEKLLEEDLKERPAATISDRRRFLQSVTGKSVSVSTIKRLLPFSQRRTGRGNGQPLCAHKGDKVRVLIESASCELLYLPPYSPDLNPIEEAVAKVKAFCEKQRLALGRLCWMRDGTGAFGDHIPGSERPLCALWISLTGSTVLLGAVICHW